LRPSLVKFQWDHLNNIDLRKFDSMGFMAVHDNKAQLQSYLDNGIAYSGIIGDKTIMIGGVCLAWPKVGFAWLLTSELVKEYKLFFHKQCKQVIESGISNLDLHRVETTIIEGHEISKIWAKRIGFEEQCLMKKYDSKGNNYYLYARVI